MAARLTPLSKVLITLIVVGTIGIAVYKRRDSLSGLLNKDDKGAVASSSGSSPPAGGKRPYKVALSQWPGHMAIVLGNGGLTTQPGSAAAAEGLDLQVVFIEEPDKKNAALQTGNVDFVWQTVDELPINMGGYKNAKVDARAFIQIDW